MKLDDWQWLELDDIAVITAGNAAPQGDEFFVGGTDPFVRVQDLGRLKGATHINATVDYVNNKASKSLKLFPKGSILFTKSGASLLLNQRAILGKDMYVVSHIGVAIPGQRVISEWLYYWLRTVDFADIAHGANMPSLPLARVKKIKIPVPPVEEQIARVSEIEKQFSRLDDAVANLKRVKANLKRYKASVLKAAVEGRLVETEAEIARREGRSYETGEQLLKRILETRRSQWQGKGKYKDPAAPDTTDLPELPEGWVWSTLGQLVWSVKDGPHYSPKYSEEGIPFISGGNIRPEGIDFSSTKFISPELHEELSKRCKPEYGDLLYTKGGTTGIARVNTEKRNFNVWVHVAVLKLLGSIEPFYLQHALNSQYCYQQAQKYTHGVGNQDLGLTRMVWITVPLPPTAEQKRIVAEIDRRLSMINELDKEIEKSLKRAEKLRDAVLSKAYGIDVAGIKNNSDTYEGKVMKGKTLPILPAHSRTKVDDERQDLTIVLGKFPDGISVEKLFIEAGYKGDQIDQFYRDLALLINQLDQIEPVDSHLNWPFESSFSLRLKG